LRRSETGHYGLSMAGSGRSAHKARGSQQSLTESVPWVQVLSSEEKSLTEVVYSMPVLCSEKTSLTETVHLLQVVGSEDISIDINQQISTWEVHT